MTDNITLPGAADTIVALSTPPGTGGIAVIRMSGPAAIAIADSVWGGKPLAQLPSHRMRFGRILSSDGETIDECVASIFRGPGSFTGEDTVEFSIHGSRWLQKEVVAILVNAGARPAEPGEFTRRAFLNGKLDLAQAEGVADMIAVSSRAAARLALSQLNGSFSRRLDALRQQLIDIASLMELELDFSEEDVEFADRTRLRELASETDSALTKLIDSYDRGRAYKEGIPVVIAGEPNVGKSTLLNLLLEEDRAIVSDIPGTTRDVIEATREIGGVLYRFHDTAGLRDTDDSIESLGIDRAEQLISKGGVTLWLIDASRPLGPQTDWLLHRVASSASPLPSFILLNKADLITDPTRLRLAIEEITKAIDALGGEEKVKVIAISANDPGEKEKIEKLLQESLGEEGDTSGEIMLTNLRHKESLVAARAAIRRLQEGLSAGIPTDLLAQEIREAIHHTGTVTGAITTDTLLHTIFSRFCIGK